MNLIKSARKNHQLVALGMVLLSASSFAQLSEVSVVPKLISRDLTNVIETCRQSFAPAWTFGSCKLSPLNEYIEGNQVLVPVSHSFPPRELSYSDGSGRILSIQFKAPNGLIFSWSCPEEQPNCWESFRDSEGRLLFAHLEEKLREALPSDKITLSYISSGPATPGPGPGDEYVTQEQLKSVQKQVSGLQGYVSALYKSLADFRLMVSKELKRIWDEIKRLRSKK